MQNWDDLRFLLAVYKHGTLTAAARDLGTNVATVSRRMARIADELGGEPFLRTPSGPRPSPAITELLSAASNLDGQMRRQQSKSHGTPISALPQLRLGCPPLITSAVLVPSLLSRGSPIDRVELEIVQRIFETGLGGHDIVIQAYRPEGSRMTLKQVGQLTFGVYRWRNAPETDRWLGLNEAHEPFESLDRARAIFGRPPIVRMENFDKVFQASRVLRMPAVLPDMLARREPALMRLDPPDGTPTEFWMFHHNRRRGDPAIQIVADWVTAAFQSLDAGVPAA